MLDDFERKVEFLYKRAELKAICRNVKKLHKEGESFFLCNQVLTLWEGINPKQLFNLLLKEELAAFRCAVNKDIPSPLLNEALSKDVEENFSFFTPYIPANIETMQKYAHFKKSDNEAYEKEHPEVLKKPEPETPKEALPPYLDGNNEHFAPELALAIRLFESIAKGEFDSGRDSLSNFVAKYLKKELPGVKLSAEMIERFSTMISKQPKSLGKNGIEAVKGKFTPL